MNGEVFHTSAMTTAILAGNPSAVHRISRRSTALAAPSAWKIHRHSRPEIAVGTAHGTRMLARTIARPGTPDA